MGLRGSGTCRRGFRGNRGRLSFLQGVCCLCAMRQTFSTLLMRALPTASPLSVNASCGGNVFRGRGAILRDHF